MSVGKKTCFFQVSKKNKKKICSYLNIYLEYNEQREDNDTERESKLMLLTTLSSIVFVFSIYYI